MIYSSKHNEIIKSAASLKDKKSRQNSGLYLVEGIKMIREAYRYGVEIERIFATEKALLELGEINAEICTVTEEVFNYLSDEKTPQGAIAVLKMRDLMPKNPTGDCMILDGVSDPGNLGTIVRTAAALGYKDIYGINCVDLYNPKTVRASMSGIYFVNYYKTEYSDIEKLFTGVEIVVADMCGEDLKEFKKQGRVAIVIGNEANGVSETLKSIASRTVKIGMEQNIESLNAAVAGSIIMYTLKK